MKWGTPVAFADAGEWREWLEQQHGAAREVFVLIRKQSSAKPGLGYEEAVQEALCFGWIDGLARRFDEDFSLNRFTARRRESNWSASNRDRVAALMSKGRMKASGLAVLPEDIHAG